MAKPIEPTAPFEGNDAVQLLEALGRVHLSPERRAHRAELSRSRITEMMRPKGYRHSVECRVLDLIPVASK